MRRTLMALISTGVLGAALLSAPTAAHAAAASYTVQGHPISAPGLDRQTYLCYSGAPAAQATFLEGQSETVGSSSLGWQMLPAGSATGPRAILAGDPVSLNTFSTDVLAPSGTTGWVFVYFEDNGDGNDYVQNYGWAEVTIPPSGAWQTLNVTSWTYEWEWYENGVRQTNDSRTVQDWAQVSGAISQAQFHVLLGCGGEPFYVDRMVVSNAVNSSTYDFEAAPAPAPAPAAPHHVAHLEWSASNGDIQTGDRVVIRYGQSLWMLGHAHVHSDAGESWYQGRGTLTALPTRGAAKEVGAKQFDPEYYAAYKVAPVQETAYRFTPDARADLPATSSNLVTVYVQSKVSAEVRDRHLVQGQRLAVSGRVLPKVKRVKVTLQRKAGGRWKNLQSTRTGRGGKFDLTTKAGTPGTWKVRVKVGATVRNLGTKTRTAKVRVDRYRPPRSTPSQPAPPPPPAQDATPEASAPVVTPQPVQAPASAPTPPDRPTPTGRPLRQREVATGRTEAAVGVAGPDKVRR